ncbi:MAG: inositol monophosphatase [Candidatus Lambdaproteobacteria bacterium RIFOXYD1_FULL_56_27]|uniref:Inositol-1-monophosphatase n=1 Tax=Candidatus Lambdaproteobacteria bacterium RIFOXYD2_FULL_56_26 TaxID=1817773 RepID=A0A1F6H417_9PROT|nr:MAG: inositol monophosphatase [Candidatus Lambdaproteobacteria bacterium RIFOXYC1_FULL_56_13]OGH05119.1 MAG: inositol monophosphatase [Candidatus Lambdaproteobacteria bacterium RIFOXYD2_FULL_56_26]OGH09583.1 MAG: inositol monophosphatase [Candidatus Lambdaproteobacteria bacterium RIFOXYD1_FULL_56_27]
MLAAGAVSLEFAHRIGDLKVREKSPRDLVTQADLAVEQYLIEALKDIEPNAGFYGEETGQTDDQNLRWVIDPIDGTHSFVRGQVFWSISVALERNGVLELGAVFAPRLHDLYLAARGEGASLNGQKIEVSKISNLSEAMVSTGFACLRAGLEENNLPRFGRIAKATLGQRRFGSAALDLCLVAQGQVDLFWEQELNLYDVAAGALILAEAGGEVCDFKGRPGLYPKEVLATNRRLTAAVLPLL